MPVKTVKGATISVRGVVQGVGFRPFVYQLAIREGLAGWVRNTSGQVEIEVEGDEESLARFIEGLSKLAPPLSHIEEVSVSYQPPRGYQSFGIQKSLAQEGKYQLVSPDIATCEACRREIFSPGDRRYGYAFTNCTNCGPRFTIIEDIPYDRARTTMRSFVMCPQCQQEYDDPLDRRFHAQPNACPRCGPHLKLVDKEGKEVPTEDVLAQACALLKKGMILAIRGLGGFLLACDATSEEAVQRLRSRKRRPFKPLAVMMADLDVIKKHCYVSPEEEKLLLSPSCPIVLLSRKQDGYTLANGVAPGLKYMGAMLPYTPLHHLLLRQVGLPLVMTSGNLSEEPIAKDNEEALSRLHGIADYFLLHNRDIYSRYDDSVYILEKGLPRPLRRARGYAPYPIHLPFSARQVLACGAELKNTFCLTKEKYAFISQHIGDLENLETLEHFEATLELYKKLFRIEPEVLAYDMHPEYLSTKFARELAEQRKDLIAVPVQHHHAHIASCLAENGFEGSALGVAFDGTGYGPDGTIWGGEFLLSDRCSFKRLGHLEYVPMPGGEAAILKPYRMALGYLYALFGSQSLMERYGLEIDPEELMVVRQQLERKLNTPLTSSCGRLFDAVAALIGLRGRVEYEAQAAIELEMAAPPYGEVPALGSYPFTIDEDGGVKVVRLKRLIETVLSDWRAGSAPGIISARFHNTVTQIILHICRLVAEEKNIKTVALSGGVFQNRLLFRLVTDALEKDGFKVLTHSQVPCNDGGISLGQAVIAHFAAELKSGG